MVLDPVTGLYNDEARWYSTAVSTFISRDPAQSTSEPLPLLREQADGGDGSDREEHLLEAGKRHW